MSNQSDLKKIMDTYISPLINSGNTPSANQAPGGIAAVYYLGNYYYFPYGRIDENNTAPDENTIFGLGSVTKTFTTSILGQREFLFGDKVMDYPIPNLNLTAQMTNLTFEQLATFTAGIPSVPSSSEGEVISDSQEDWVNFLNAIVPSTSLPTNNVYSNSSIGLLAQTLMNIDGISDFSDISTTAWLRDNLFDALNMAYTSAPPNIDANHPLSEAFVFKNGNYVVGNYSGWVPWGAAGRLYSTASDMLQFIQANIGLYSGDDQIAVISDGMSNALSPWAWMGNTQSSNRQGFAWIVWPLDVATRSQIRGKDGGVSGVSSFLSINPEMQYGMILLTNMQGVATQQPVISAMEAIREL